MFRSLSPLPRRAAFYATLPTALSMLAALGGCAATAPTPSPEFSSFVVLGENGHATARVLIEAPTCPAIEIDGRGAAMQLRAGAQTVAQRPTQSAQQDSKPSVFAPLTCEAALPAGTTRASVLGRVLPLAAAEPRRIVVIGDTGCQIKKSADAYQECNDAERYPFARIAAAAAAWQPDLVLHMGDYHYRENACPPERAGCAGSPWGYGWDAWRADFFAPGAPLLRAAPWVMARGNHESCARAGQGFWRFLDPRPLLVGRDCNEAADDAEGDYSDPYAVPLGRDAQLLVIDTSNTAWRGFKPGATGMAKYRDQYRKLEALTQRAGYNIGVNHQPILAFRAETLADGKIELQGGDAGLQQAFGSLNPMLLPPRIQVMLSGHVHLWQQVSFSSAHPTQFVSGFSGTAEDIVPLPARLPPGATPAPGAAVEHFSSWVDGFGFMTMERGGAEQWQVTVWNRRGEVENTCRVDGAKSVCAREQVPAERKAAPSIIDKSHD